MASSETLYHLGHSLTHLKDFALERWRERAAERGLPEPEDLSSACKFASLFLQELYGGEIKGNWHHQWNFIDGEIVDLTEGSRELAELAIEGIEIYRHDPVFFGNPEYLESLESCRPRVWDWVARWNAGA